MLLYAVTLGVYFGYTIAPCAGQALSDVINKDGALNTAGCLQVGFSLELSCENFAINVCESCTRNVCLFITQPKAIRTVNSMCYPARHGGIIHIRTTHNHCVDCYSAGRRGSERELTVWCS